jgi:cytochrome c556
LAAVLQRNAKHAQEWLDAGDYKSLVQTAGGLSLLADLLSTKGDDVAWQKVTTPITTAATNLQAAARQEDATACRAALHHLTQAVKTAAEQTPTGQPKPSPANPGIRPLMLTMDAIQADAKILLMTGNIDSAKKQSRVLSELARIVSNSRVPGARGSDSWSSLAADFEQATLAAANATETDAKEVRPLLRAVSERCDACHERSRTR